MKLAIGSLIAVLVALAVAYVFFVRPVIAPPVEEPVFCTLDAKLCPDGSYVGRVGPSCEFAACPGTAL